MAKRGSENEPQLARKSARMDSVSYNSPLPPIPPPEPFAFEGRLADLNPSTLIKHFRQLPEGQQMRDLYEVIVYNGVLRRPIEASWKQWVDCRVRREPDFIYKVLEYPLECTKDASHHMSPPHKIIRAVLTYHNIQIQAGSQGLQALTIEASKKVMDCILLSHIKPNLQAPIERTLPDYIQWFEAALQIVKDSVKVIPDPNSQKKTPRQAKPSSLGICPSLPNAPEPAGNSEGESDNTAGLAEAVDRMLFKPTESIPDFKDIALEENIRREILGTLCMPVMLPKQCEPGTTLGILLHGVPGCGKSLIVQSAAKEYGLTMFDVAISSVFSKWQGESEKFFKHLFQRAIELQPSIIFIDQIDRIMAVRSLRDSTSVSLVKGTISKVWQDLYNCRHQVVLVGSTNYPDTIDPAFLRHFNHRLHVNLPSNEAKSKIIKLALQNRRHCLKPNDIHEIVHEKGLLKDISGDDITKTIANLVRQLATDLLYSRTWERVTKDGKEVIRPAIPTEDNKDNLIHGSWNEFSEDDRDLLAGRPLDKKILVKAFKSRKPSHQANDIQKQLAWSQAHGTGP